MKKGNLFLIVLGLVVQNAFAINLNGLYLGGQAGWGNIHQDIESSSALIVINGLTSTSNITVNRISPTGIAGRVFAGYQFTPNIALELGYTRFHDVVDNYTVDIFQSTLDNSYVGKTTVKTEAADLLVKGIIPFYRCFNVYGKLGAAFLRTTDYNNIETNFSGFPPTEENSTYTESKIYPAFSLGASYIVTKNLIADISWNHIQKIGSTEQLGNTDFYALGLIYLFC